VITGNTSIIAHIGFPTYTFKSPMIYNPYFESIGVDTIVVPFGCEAEHFPEFLRAVFKLKNIVGALITMPHKISTVALLDQHSTTVAVTGACNAVRRNAQGQLEGDMFDGEGFVRGLQRKDFNPSGKSALVLGCGGVGSAIAASLAKAGVQELNVYDVSEASSKVLAQRLQQHYPQLRLRTDCKDPTNLDLVVNATPLGMKAGDPLPVDVEKLSRDCFVGEVVLSAEMTPFLLAAQARGCRVQVGSDMLFEQIPAYLDYFGLPSTTGENLRKLSRLSA
jgi:shikimate dehydrogenase